MEGLSDLTPTERQLVDTIEAGRKAKGCGTRPEVRADVLGAVLLASADQKRRLVELENFRFVGNLNVRYAVLGCAIEIRDCSFAGKVLTDRATLNSIEIHATDFADGISATGIIVKGDFALLHSQVIGGLNLAYAKVGGELTCEGTDVTGRDWRALDLTMAEIGGDLNLRANSVDGVTKRFVADGEVCIQGATIHGTFSCSGGLFNGPNSDEFEWGLNAESATIHSHVHLRKSSTGYRFEAKGGVNFHNADIGGEFSCQDSYIRSEPNSKVNSNSEGGTQGQNHHGIALHLIAVKVANSAHLDGLIAIGAVILDRSEIGGDLDCSGTRLQNPRNDTAHLDVPQFCALSISFAVVKGRFVWTSAVPTGRVQLYHAKVGFLDDDRRSWGFTRDTPTKPKLVARAAAIVRRIPIAVTATQRQILIAVGRQDHSLTQSIGDAKVTTARIMSYELNGFKYDGLGRSGAEWSYEQRLEWVAASGMRNDHEHRQNAYVETQPYDQIVQVLRQVGRDADAREIAIVKHNHSRNADRSTTLTKIGRIRSGIWSWFLLRTIAYGYKPWLSIRWALLFIAIGTIVFYEADRNGAMMPTMGWARPSADITKGIGQLPSRAYVADGYPRLLAPVYAIDTFLPIINLRQRDYWIPRPTGFFGWLALLFLWFQTVTGWVLTSALVAALSGLVKKE
jgi:hypothetical protein